MGNMTKFGRRRGDEGRNQEIETIGLNELRARIDWVGYDDLMAGSMRDTLTK